MRELFTWVLRLEWGDGEGGGMGGNVNARMCLFPIYPSIVVHEGRMVVLQWSHILRKNASLNVCQQVNLTDQLLRNHSMDWALN